MGYNKNFIRLKKKARNGVPTLDNQLDFTYNTENFKNQLGKDFHTMTFAIVLLPSLFKLHILY